MYAIYCQCGTAKLWARFRCGETSFHAEQKKATLFSTEQSVSEEVAKHRHEPFGLFFEVVIRPPSFLVWKETNEKLFWDTLRKDWVGAKRMPEPFDNIQEAAALVDAARKEDDRPYNIIIS